MSLSRPGTGYRNARELLRDLMPNDGDIETFVEAVARHRGRSIVLHPVELSTEAPSGAWVIRPDADYVVYSALAGPYQRDMTICHELAHMLLDHKPAPDATARLDLATVIAPDIPTDLAARLLLRHGYETPIESDAERLATEAVTLATKLRGRWERRNQTLGPISRTLR